MRCVQAIQGLCLSRQWRVTWFGSGLFATQASPFGAALVAAASASELAPLPEEREGFGGGGDGGGGAVSVAGAPGGGGSDETENASQASTSHAPSLSHAEHDGGADGGSQQAVQVRAGSVSLVERRKASEWPFGTPRTVRV